MTKMTDDKARSLQFRGWSGKFLAEATLSHYLGSMSSETRKGRDRGAVHLSGVQTAFFRPLLRKTLKMMTYNMMLISLETETS